MELETKEPKPTLWIATTVVLLVALVGLSVFTYQLYQKSLEPKNTNTQTPPPPPPATAPQPSYTLTIAGELNKYTVTLTDNKTQEITTVVKEARSAAMSPDLKTIAYVVTTPKSKMLKGDVYLYDIATDKSTLFLGGQDATWGAEWSPNSKYVVLDSGTYVARGYTPVEVATKSVKKEFVTTDNVSDEYDQYYWIDEESIVYMTPSRTVDEVNVPFGNQVLNAIEKIDVTTGKVTKLIDPKVVGKNYYFTGALPKDGSIEIKEYTYKGKVTKLFDLDLETGKLTEVK